MEAPGSEQLPAWPATVVHVIDKHNVVINRGKVNGVRMGQTIIIYGIGPALSDPDTGEQLGELEVVRGHGEVVHLQEKMATVRSISKKVRAPGRKIIRRTSEPTWREKLLINPWNLQPERVEEEQVFDQEETALPFEGATLGDRALPVLVEK